MTRLGLLLLLEHELYLSIQTHVALHEEGVEEHIYLRLEEGDEVFRFNELRVHVVLPLDSEVLPHCLDAVHLYRVY